MIEIAYGTQTFRLEIPPERVVFDLSPNDIAPGPNVSQAIAGALAHPLGTPPLRQIVAPGQTVALIGDDYSRTTPARLIIPAVLAELNAAGIPDRDICLVVATGTHRAMTDDELEAKFGSAVLGRLALFQHDARNDAELLRWGVTRRGTTIHVSKVVMAADVRVGIGSICPHFPTGWSGGAKIVLPGVAGEATTAQMHLLGAREPHLGGEAESPMREEMEDFARAIGLAFIVNTVHNRAEDVVAVFAGDFVAAHRAGVRCAQKVWSVPFRRAAGLTLVSTSPIDYDLGQAGKGILAGISCTQEGGEILLLSPCWEGYGPTHLALDDYLALDREALWALAGSGKSVDPVAVAIALNIWHARARARLTVVAEGLTPAMAGRIGMRHVASVGFPAYLASRLTDPSLTVGIIRQGAHVVPVPAD